MAFSLKPVLPFQRLRPWILRDGTPSHQSIKHPFCWWSILYPILKCCCCCFLLFCFLKIYYDKTSDGTGWILIARFSNSDAKNWVKFSGSWWYDVTEAQGNSIDPSDNADMISPAFWLISGRNFKITRSDDALHTPLLQTTGDCLEGKSFRHKMLKYGFFRYGVVWARRRCQDDCEVNYGWPNETTYGFKQAKCDGPLQSSNKIGFWCDWESGGSVMMVGGGGGTCGGSDHGIGITEKNGGASFHNMEHKFDFGNDANPLNNGTTKNYSLNLWIN